MAAVGDLTTHTGNPAFYVQNAEPGSTASVNFASEQVAGRYKGGFIGFYLIAPEGNPSNNNCGDFKNGTTACPLLGGSITRSATSTTTRLRHHLVYRSKLVANRFYFGSRGPVRGGDNDFEDMLIQTVGLTPPCIPQPRSADGLDNDCGHARRRQRPGSHGCRHRGGTCDGVASACDNGPLFGRARRRHAVPPRAPITCTHRGRDPARSATGLATTATTWSTTTRRAPGAACDGADADLSRGHHRLHEWRPGVQRQHRARTSRSANGLDEDCDAIDRRGNPGGVARAQWHRRVYAGHADLHRRAR